MKRKGSMTMALAGAAAVALGAFTLAPAVNAGPEHDHTKMTAKVGHKAPNFTLTDTNGKTYSLEKALEKHDFVVLEWFNPDCPFVVAHHKTGSTMRDLYADFKGRGVGWLAINSGAPGEQGVGLERNQRAIEEYKMPYPILIDEPGDVGRMYDAKTTPHMYIINKKGTLIYAGGIDDGPRNATVNYVRQALEQALAGETITAADTKPYGCSVKYKN